MIHEYENIEFVKNGIPEKNRLEKRCSMVRF